MVSQLNNVDLNIAERAAAGLGLEGKLPQFPTKVPVKTGLKASPALSTLAKAKPTLKGSKIAVLTADGTDATWWSLFAPQPSDMRQTLQSLRPK